MSKHIRSAETLRSSTQPPAFETEVIQSTDRNSYKDADFAALMKQKLSRLNLRKKVIQPCPIMGQSVIWIAFITNKAF